jgi:menaquinone-dependent protoporphyrinogen oxidase
MTKSRALIVFHTVEGQSARIATAIAAELWSRGIDADIWPAETAPAPDAYDGVVVGDSIHAGRHSTELRRYLREHGAALRNCPVGLFQVSLASANDDSEHTAEAHELVEQLETEADLAPVVVAMLAGRLAYSQYGWLKKRLMRWISRREGGDTDMSRDYEYTNWDVVRSFADDLATAIGIPATS